MKVLRSFETLVALSVDTTYSTFQETSIVSNTAVTHSRLIITYQPCRVVAFLKPRFPNTIVVRWVTINSLQRSQCNLASDNPEAERNISRPRTRGGVSGGCSVLLICHSHPPQRSDSTSGSSVVLWSILISLHQISADSCESFGFFFSSGFGSPSIQRNIL
jgi:hypothetical protein